MHGQRRTEGTKAERALWELLAALVGIKVTPKRHDRGYPLRCETRPDGLDRIIVRAELFPEHALRLAEAIRKGVGNDHAITSLEPNNSIHNAEVATKELLEAFSGIDVKMTDLYLDAPCARCEDLFSALWVVAVGSLLVDETRKLAETIRRGSKK